MRMESAPIFEDSITGCGQEFRGGVAKFGGRGANCCESTTRGAKLGGARGGGGGGAGAGRLAQAREQVEAAEADPLPPRLAAEVAAEAEDDDDDDMSAEDDYGILIQP